MIKKSFLILIILLSFPAAIFGFGSKEKTASAGSKTLLRNMDKYEQQWKSNKITNYTQEIIYSRSNFPPEHITITVSNNIVNEWSTNSERRNFSEDFIGSLTVENIFKTAREALRYEPNSPFEFEISYNEKLGYITSFSRIPVGRNNINPPRGLNYRIEIISLEIIKGIL